MESFEYAIKKDVRNSAIVREIDEERQRELWTSVGIACLLVLVLRFSAIVIERVPAADPPARSVVALR